jgi:2-polyprenyl-6-hydroxyphenyl methylase/3-demethylubiquinone-9 3-methyltransferase
LKDKKMKNMQKKSRNTPQNSTVDSAEVAQFDKLAGEWWDENGALRPLHKLNPARIGYLKAQICVQFRRDAESFTPLTGLTLADIGCGGGLVTEPMCRLGATVTGVDAAKDNIKIAKQHAQSHGLDIDYQATTVEALAQKKQQFDVVLALEIIEHVSDPALFLESCAALVKKNGLLIVSTLNRTPKSFLLGIVAAEYILRWVPAGTHQWQKFRKPSEIALPLQSHGMTVGDISGLVYHPLIDQFRIDKNDLAVNYFLTAVKK